MLQAFAHVEKVKEEKARRQYQELKGLLKAAEAASQAGGSYKFARTD